jgi:hypothetical protein
VIGGTCTMTLFSWFISSTRVNSGKNKKVLLEQELSTLNKSTMWPVAKVRTNTLIQQQKYINSASHLQQVSKVDKIKAHTYKSQVN